MTDAALLKAAAAVAPVVSASRLVMARELKAWTQKEAVASLDRDLTAAALSQLENGHTSPSAPTLLALAEAYGCPLEFFVDRPGDSEPKGFFRSLRSTPARDAKQYIARARLLRDFVSVIENYVVLPDARVPRIQLDRNNPRAVEEAADQVRAQWQVPPGPIDNVVRLLERHGVVVVRVSEFIREVDAFSVRFDDRPIVVLGATKGVTSRSRFDAAHELAHLVLHNDEDAGTKEAEKEAHQFAAAFLMPREDIRDLLPADVDLRVLRQLKTEWRVSLQALLMRSRDLGVMTGERYTGAMKLFSARGWRQREPGDDLLGAIESPTMLDNAISKLEDHGISLERLCAEGSLPLEQVSLIRARTQDRRLRLDF